MTDPRAEFLRVARTELSQASGRVVDCLSKLSLDQIWRREHAIENSVGNLVLHLAGNVRQWILSGVGDQPDDRDRDWEFENRERIPAQELGERLSATVAEADRVLRDLNPARLTEVRHIQVFPNITVLHAITHVLTHFAGHTGQVIWATKHVTGQDLGYYSYLKKGVPEERDPTT
ncbi:MAG: DUF1572 family protein [Bryobacterales bacterium]|nr:DUF1572 family protein [Bryobacterales bacterium]